MNTFVTSLVNSYLDYLTPISSRENLLRTTNDKVYVLTVNIESRFPLKYLNNLWVRLVKYYPDKNVRVQYFKYLLCLYKFILTAMLAYIPGIIYD